MDPNRIECLSGWRNLYQPIIESCAAAGVEIQKVTEKFGGLHFEVNPPPPIAIMHAIRKARMVSLVTCEVCGDPGEPHASRGRTRIKTLCESHAIEYATTGLAHYR